MQGQIKIYLRCAQLRIFGDEFFDISWQVDADIFLMAVEMADAHKAVRLVRGSPDSDPASARKHGHLTLVPLLFYI